MAARAIVTQIRDTNGDLISGGKVNVYEAGTTTRVTLYTSASLGTATTNPVTAASDAVAIAWINDSVGDIKVTVTNADGSVMYFTEDNIDSTQGPFIFTGFRGDQGTNTNASPTFAGLTLTGALSGTTATLTGRLTGESYVVGNNAATGGGDTGLIYASTDQFRIVPTDRAGSYNFSKEFLFDAAGDAVWTAEGGFRATGALTVTTGGANITGNIVVSGTVDGRDVAADGTKLDTIQEDADVTGVANVTTALGSISIGAHSDVDVSGALGGQPLIYNASTSRFEPGTEGSSLIGQSYTPSFDDAVARTIRSRIEERVSVKDFGAVGDGVTDDRAAIEAALQYLRDNATVSTPICIYFPTGTYRIRTSVTGSIGSKVCFELNGVDGWALRGAGMGQTRLLFDPSNTNGARMFDVFNCDWHIISDMWIGGVTTPTESGGSLVSAGVLARAINTRGPAKNFAYQNLYLYLTARYAMGHEQGKFENGLWENIWIEWTGNDGIDMKDDDGTGTGTPAGNTGLIFRNIYGVTWGNLQYAEPNSLVDVRGPADISGVYAATVNENGVIVRTTPTGLSGSPARTGGQKTRISNVIGKGSSILAADNQIGIQVTTEDTTVSNVYLEGLYQGVSTTDNDDSEGRGQLIGADIRGCTTGVYNEAVGFSIIGGNLVNNVTGVDATVRTRMMGLEFAGTSQIPVAFGASSAGSELIGGYNTGTTASTINASAVGTLTVVGAEGHGAAVDDEGVQGDLNICDGGAILRSASGAIVGRADYNGSGMLFVRGTGSQDGFDVRAGFTDLFVSSARAFRFAGAFFRPEAANTDLGTSATANRFRDLHLQRQVLLAGTKVLGERQIEAALANTANSGDADTDALITALKDIVLAHGLGAAS